MAYVAKVGARDGAERTEYETLSAPFWSDDLGSATPPGHWNVIAQDLPRRHELSTDGAPIVLFAGDVGPGRGAEPSVRAIAQVERARRFFRHALPLLRADHRTDLGGSVAWISGNHGFHGGLGQRLELGQPLDVVADGAQADQPELAALCVEVHLVARLRPLVVAHDDVGEAAVVGDERAAAFLAGDDARGIEQRLRALKGVAEAVVVALAD